MIFQTHCPTCEEAQAFSLADMHTLACSRCGHRVENAFMCSECGSRDAAFVEERGAAFCVYCVGEPDPERGPWSA